MPKLNFIVILVYSFPEALILGWLCLSLLGIRPTFRQILQIGSLQAIFAAFLFLVVGKLISIPFGVHTIIQMASLMGIIYSTMPISYKKSMLAVFLGWSVFTCIEVLTVSSYIFITGQPIAILSESNWWSRLPYFASKLMINLLLILLIRGVSIRLANIWEKIGNKQFLWIAGLLFTQSILIDLFCWKYLLQYMGLLPPFYFYFYFAIINIVLPIITIIVVKQFVTLTKSEVEFKVQLDNLHYVEGLLHTMRIQRHDFTHELQVIYGLLEVEEFQEARNYLRKSVSEVVATSQLVKTDNLGVTALLYVKTGLAEARKIDLRIAVETSLQQFPLEARDINLILGNLIDNALDAVTELPIPERKVEVTIGQDLAGYVLEVKNYGPPILQDAIDKIFAPGFSTKGEGRGMGLYSIQKLVHKYNGKIRVRSDSEGTCFQVVISGDQPLGKPQRVKRSFWFLGGGVKNG
ncbi:sensor histidine kinase [Pelosinus fermentans]|uniref:Signal transduction histidine kinase regulating citrate/malate metabolism n=1 Tax=Pelosinus fermentans JBW45 TaxID=1192197 RepID=I9DJH5_9FIRM|nr:ATP-binding protein [Pelosinus fermentans]AJQ29993.1 signal transduction histidine kinase regulating citrate/malate metabolism [Pelosinus fermentans JBW45]